MPYDIPILLTSTILPHETNGIYKIVQSEEDRFREYCKVLKHTARSGLFREIVFADNSSTKKITALRQLADSLCHEGLHIEVLHFPETDESLVRGKGFGEGRLISNAIEASEFLKKATSFIKLTGRYKIHNLYRVLPVLVSAINSREKPAFVGWDFRFYKEKVPILSTICFWCRTELWKNSFQDAYMKVDDKNGWALEAEVAKRLLEVLSAGVAVGEVQLPLVMDVTNTKNNQALVSRYALLIACLKSWVGYRFRPQPGIRFLSVSSWRVRA